MGTLQSTYSSLWHKKASDSGCGFSLLQLDSGGTIGMAVQGRQVHYVHKHDEASHWGRRPSSSLSRCSATICHSGQSAVLDSRCHGDPQPQGVWRTEILEEFASTFAMLSRPPFLFHVKVLVLGFPRGDGSRPSKATAEQDHAARLQTEG